MGSIPGNRAIEIDLASLFMDQRSEAVINSDDRSTIK